MLKKIILFFFLFLFRISLLPEAARILKIINNSSQKVAFFIDAYNSVVKAHSSKKVLMDIPFNSKQDNFIALVQDRPYVPAATIEITTMEGLFYIWQDEDGIKIAKKFELGMRREEALPQLLISLSHKDKHRLLGYLMTIDKSGSPNISKS